MEKIIRAKRNGVTRNFHPNTWAMFPEDKYGFVAIPPDPTPPPPVVIAAMQSVAAPQETKPVKQRKPRKKAANKI